MDAVRASISRMARRDVRFCSHETRMPLATSDYYPALVDVHGSGENSANSSGMQRLERTFMGQVISNKPAKFDCLRNCCAIRVTFRKKSVIQRWKVKRGKRGLKDSHARRVTIRFTHTWLLRASVANLATLVAR